MTHTISKDAAATVDKDEVVTFCGPSNIRMVTMTWRELDSFQERLGFVASDTVDAPTFLRLLSHISHNTQTK